MQSYIQFTYELLPDQVRDIYNDYLNEHRDYTTVALTETTIYWPMVKHLYTKQALKCLKISDEDLRTHDLKFNLGAMFKQDFLAAIKKLEMLHVPDSIYVRFHITYNDADKFNTFKNKMKLKRVNIEELDNYHDFKNQVHMKII